MLALALAAAAGSAVAEGAPLKPAPNDAEVGVLSSGTILLSGRRSSIARITARLAVVKRKGGMVWFYRQNPSAMPSERMQKSIEAVEELLIHDDLPRTLSTKPDYSDVMELNGRVHRRGTP